MNDSIELAVRREDVIVLNYLRGNISIEVAGNNFSKFSPFGWLDDVLADAKTTMNYEPVIPKEALFNLIAHSVGASFSFESDRYYLRKQDWLRDYTFFPSDIEKMTPLDFALRLYKHNQKMETENG